MNDRLPYEEQLAQQWNDLPLPDENMAWDDMKRRLDEDDNDRIIPIWLRGCGIWALVGIVLIAIGWWFVDKQADKKPQTENMSISKEQDKEKNTTPKANKDDTHLRKTDTISKVSRDSRKDLPRISPSDSILYTPSKKPKKGSQVVAGKAVTGVVPAVSTAKKKNRRLQPSVISTVGKKSPPVKRPDKKTNDPNIDISVSPTEKDKDIDKTSNIKEKPITATIDSISLKIDSLVRKEPVNKVSKDSVVIKDSTFAQNDRIKKDSSDPQSISFGAGLGMHQLIPVAGQKLNPYTSSGRKGSLADYIPSAYVRMYKGNKWFVQLEFRYGAPQYTKEFVYQQQSKFDTIGGTQFATTVSSKLKKTFYHQLPVTFNYFVRPNWSVGTGIVWNKFVSAVSQEDISRRNTTTGAVDSVQNRILTDKNDSIFKKSYFQAVFETQYRWRRFTVGAKYSFGLQPYIKFTLPGGQPSEERNKSIQLFLRYELWKSKPKK